MKELSISQFGISGDNPYDHDLKYTIEITCNPVIILIDRSGKQEKSDKFMIDFPLNIRRQSNGSH